MDLPPGFDEDRKFGKVCRLKKLLYGLKQSLRAWFDRFTKAILQNGYKQAHTDHTLFYKRDKEKIAIIIVYVDGIKVTGNDKVEWTKLRRDWLHIL